MVKLPQYHKDIINIVNSKINVTFEKNTKLKGYYTNIHVNTTGIIIENEFSVYNPHTEKTVDKRAYTEICNQRQYAEILLIKFILKKNYIMVI